MDWNQNNEINQCPINMYNKFLLLCEFNISYLTISSAKNCNSMLVGSTVELFFFLTWNVYTSSKLPPPHWWTTGKCHTVEMLTDHTVSQVLLWLRGGPTHTVEWLTFTVSQVQYIKFREVKAILKCDGFYFISLIIILLKSDWIFFSFLRVMLSLSSTLKIVPNFILKNSLLIHPLQLC